MLIRTIFIAVLFLASCSEGQTEKPSDAYEDIKGLFEAEAVRLNKLNPKVNKTVSRNNIKESKNQITVDWKNELSLFSESDINKPAWRNSYKISGSGSDLTYTALDSNLRTRSIHIRKSKEGLLNYISIVNKTHNYLYQSTEELSYIPDSVYKIAKKQKVLLMGSNEYEITGIQQ